MGSLGAYRIECGGAVYWLAMWRHDRDHLVTARKLIEEVGDESIDDEALVIRAMTDADLARLTIRDEDEGPISFADHMASATAPHVVACSEWP